MTLFINVSGAVAEMLERSVLKVVQSPEARYPFVDADALGIEITLLASAESGCVYVGCVS